MKQIARRLAELERRRRPPPPAAAPVEQQIAEIRAMLAEAFGEEDVAAALALCRDGNAAAGERIAVRIDSAGNPESQT
jgi:hypothetical protein